MSTCEVRGPGSSVPAPELAPPPAGRSRPAHAAGGVLWRPGRLGVPEVALVHRPRHDDWTLPKGKAKQGEHLVAAALREVAEETGHTPRLGPFLARYRYTPPRRGSASTPRARRHASYWAMPAADGEFAPSQEVDDVAWLPVAQAVDRVSYTLDRRVLGAFEAVPGRTTPIVVVRSARSGARAGPDGRPLDLQGWRQADSLVAVLTGAGVQRLWAAPSVPCVQTVQPFSARAGVTIELDGSLCVLGQLPSATTTAARLLEHARAGVPTGVCIHGPGVAPLVTAIARATGSVKPVEPLRRGGWWLLHVADGHLVAMERHAPVG